MSKKAVWFQLYPQDFIADRAFRLMNMTERGLYLTLILEQAIERSLPEDEAMLKKLVGLKADVWRRSWTDRVKDKFPLVEPGIRRNPRLAKELEKYYKTQEAGEKAAKARWEPMRSHIRSHTDPICDPNAIQKQKQKQKQTGEVRTKDQLVLIANSEPTSPPEPDKRVPVGGRVLWNQEKQKVEPSAKFRAEFIQLWSKYFSEDEMGIEFGKLNRWLVKRPDRRTSRSRLDTTCHNWFEKALRDKQADAEIQAKMANKTPERSKWCQDCRETLPAHEPWCQRGGAKPPEGAAKPPEG